MKNISLFCCLLFWISKVINSVATNKFASKCATILPKCAQKSATALHKIILTPSSIFIAFLCFNFFQMSNFSVKKIKFTSKQFLNFVSKSYCSVPITLKNAPLWNFLRHQCLKCAHMSTIALTIRHTARQQQRGATTSTTEVLRSRVKLNDFY